MKLLPIVYAMLCIAGLIVGHYGVAMLSFVCSIFFYWADKKMDKLPAPAVRLKTTMEALDEYCCECCNPNSPRQISFSDSDS